MKMYHDYLIHKEVLKLQKCAFFENIPEHKIEILVRKMEKVKL